ncbi:MAG: nuclear transport factor 2 family protein, partial [Pseudomonadota bacterium]
MTQAAIETTLERWHAMIASRDLEALHEIIRPDAVFRSPVAHTPYEGRDALVLALDGALEAWPAARDALVARSSVLALRPALEQAATDHAAAG